MEFNDSSSPYRLRGPHDYDKKDPFVERLLHPLSMDFIHLMEEEKRNSSNGYRRTQNSTDTGIKTQQKTSETSKQTEKPTHGFIQRVSYDAGFYTNRPEGDEGKVSGFASLPYFALGTAIQTLPAALDRAAIRSATLTPDSLLGTWAKHSKNAREYQTLIEGIQHDSKVYRAATIQIDMNRPRFMELEERIQKVLNGHIRANTSPLIQRKIDFLENFLKNPSNELLESALASNGEVLKSAPKAFIHDAKEVPLFKDFVGVSKAHEQAVLSQAQAAQRLTQAQEAAAKLSTRVDELAKSGLKKGLLYSGGSICAGYTIDGFLGTMLGYEPKNNPVRLFFDGVVIPAVIQAPLGRLKPIALIGAESIARIAAATGS